jgi:hypothetical protein
VQDDDHHARQQKRTDRLPSSVGEVEGVAPLLRVENCQALRDEEQFVYVLFKMLSGSLHISANYGPLIGLAVLKIRRAQFGSTGEQIIKATCPKRFEIEQVACDFLN